MSASVIASAMSVQYAASRAPVVPALDDMPGNSGDSETGSSWHSVPL